MMNTTLMAEEIDEQCAQIEAAPSPVTRPNEMLTLTRTAIVLDEPRLEVLVVRSLWDEMTPAYRRAYALTLALTQLRLRLERKATEVHVALSMALHNAQTISKAARAS